MLVIGYVFCNGGLAWTKKLLGSTSFCILPLLHVHGLLVLFYFFFQGQTNSNQGCLLSSPLFWQGIYCLHLKSSLFQLLFFCFHLQNFLFKLHFYNQEFIPLSWLPFKDHFLQIFPHLLNTKHQIYNPQTLITMKEKKYR